MAKEEGNWASMSGEVRSDPQKPAVFYQLFFSNFELKTRYFLRTEGQTKRRDFANNNCTILIFFFFFFSVRCGHNPFWRPSIFVLFF